MLNSGSTPGPALLPPPSPTLAQLPSALLPPSHPVPTSLGGLTWLWKRRREARTSPCTRIPDSESGANTLFRAFVTLVDRHKGQIFPYSILNSAVGNWSPWTQPMPGFRAWERSIGYSSRIWCCPHPSSGPNLPLRPPSLYPALPPSASSQPSSHPKNPHCWLMMQLTG